MREFRFRRTLTVECLFIQKKVLNLSRFGAIFSLSYRPEGRLFISEDYLLRMRCQVSYCSEPSEMLRGVASHRLYDGSSKHLRNIGHLLRDYTARLSNYLLKLQVSF